MQAKSKKTFKSLDGSIMAVAADTNTMEGVSNKCSEIDRLVAMLMNVSRPILEHVVFVHQEESLWPLSENNKLKEKFDSIFAATKYTDAIKRMSDVVKGKNAVRGRPVMFCLVPIDREIPELMGIVVRVFI